MSNSAGALWAITSFFNPVGYRRRLVNYRRFRGALTVPLATIELGFNGRWELEEQDADLLVRVGDGDVMWQKERLLNLLLKQLPPECEYVAWIDSDALFQDREWPQRAVEQLQAVPLVQLFAKLYHLDREENRQIRMRCRPSAAADELRGRPAFAGLLESNFVELLPRHPSSASINRARVKPAHGMAWAARRELLERHGFYDRCVIGGGDTALGGAAYGVPEVVVGLLRMNADQRDHYSRWASGFHDDVKGQVGALAGEIHTLWHGDIEDRRYSDRQNDLVAHRFDPTTDIRLGADGAWRWASEKPALHALLRDYFHNRQEDGKPS